MNPNHIVSLKNPYLNSTKPPSSGALRSRTHCGVESATVIRRKSILWKFLRGRNASVWAVFTCQVVIPVALELRFQTGRTHFSSLGEGVSNEQQKEIWGVLFRTVSRRVCSVSELEAAGRKV